MKKFFTRLFRVFRQRQADVLVNRQDPIVGPLKWGFVVPHSKATGGAVLKEIIDGKEVVTQEEYHYGLEMIRKLSSRLGVTMATRDNGGLNGAYGWLNVEGCTASIEPHLNAYNTKAKGYEVLILKGDDASRFYAEELLNLFKLRFPNRVNRGIKEVVAGKAGFENLRVAKSKGMKVALLSELFFIDNKSEFISTDDMANFFAGFLVGKDV